MLVLRSKSNLSQGAPPQALPTRVAPFQPGGQGVAPRTDAPVPAAAEAQVALLRATSAQPARATHLARQIQRRYGNQYVQRLLAPTRDGKHASPAGPLRGPGAVVQRDTQPAAAPAPVAKGESAEKKDEGFNLERWLQGKIYELLKKELGEDKLKEHAKKLADQAAKLLMDQAKGAASEEEFVQKAQLDQLGKQLAEDVQKGVNEIIASPAGTRLRQAILNEAKTSPDAAIGMALIALAVAIAANIEIPDLKKSLDLGKGFKLEGEAKLGKVRDFAPKYLKLGIAYSSKYFQAGLGGTYTGVGEAEGVAAQATTSVGTSEYKFSADASLDADGRFKLNIGPAITLRNFGLSGTGTFDTAKGWSGVGQLRLGPQQGGLVSRVTVEPDGKLTFGHSFGTPNLFGVSGLSASANLSYRVDDPALAGVGLSAAYPLLGSEKDRKNPYLIIKLDGGYKPGTPDQPRGEIKGFILLEGRFGSRK